MLIVHRRHTDECPHRYKGRDYRKCACPLWIDWRVSGKRIQKPLGTRDWGVAQIQARKIEVDGLTTTLVPTTVESACDKYLEDGKARGLKEESLRKYRQLFKQMKEHSKAKGIVRLSNLTTPELLEFRTTWKNSNRSAKKKLELMKAFFRHCLAAQFISTDPPVDIKPPKSWKNRSSRCSPSSRRDVERRKYRIHNLCASGGGELGHADAAQREGTLMDHVLAYMKKVGLSLDAETYCSLNYSLSWEEVEAEYPEWCCEVLDLVSEGELCWVQ
jgi:hypothetical protein